MSSNIIYPQGGLEVDIIVPTGESIAVYTKDVARVYQISSYHNYPNKKNLIGTVTNYHASFGPYLDGATLQINAGAAKVLYQVGTSPALIEYKGLRFQETAITIGDSNITLTAEMMLNGILESVTDNNVEITLTPYSELIGAINHANHNSFDWSLIMHGSGSLTMKTGINNNFHGYSVINTNISATFRTRVDLNHFDTYRLS